jgi:UDP-sugar transporter A1/2/3
VAVVVKYADNVLKGFATSLSILISSLVSWYMFHDLTVNVGFLAGAVIVLAAVYWYGYTPPVKPVRPQDLDEERQQLMTA